LTYLLGWLGNIAFQIVFGSLAGVVLLFTVTKVTTYSVIPLIGNAIGARILGSEILSDWLVVEHRIVIIPGEVVHAIMQFHGHAPPYHGLALAAWWSGVILVLVGGFAWSVPWPDRAGLVLDELDGSRRQFWCP